MKLAFSNDRWIMSAVRGLLKVVAATWTVILLVGVSASAQTPASSDRADMAAKTRALAAENAKNMMPGCVGPSDRLSDHKRIEHEWVDPDHNVPQGAEYRTFHSKTIDHDVSYVLALPPGYSAASKKRYPVVYLLSGSSTSPARTANCFVPISHSLMQKQMIPEFIEVFLNGLNDNMYIDSYDKKFPNETIIIKELIPYIDSTLRTIPDRSARGVSGYSMGGYGAAHLAFGHPDLFGSISILDAGLFSPEELSGTNEPGPDPSSNTFGSNKAYYIANFPPTLLEKNADKIRGRTFIQVANGEFDKCRPGGELLHAQLNRLHIEHDFAIREGMGHALAAKIDPMTRPDLLEQYLFYKKAFAGVHDKT